jgi:membrane-associated protease RseP (regulator of RpoE activity)
LTRDLGNQSRSTTQQKYIRERICSKQKFDLLSLFGGFMIRRSLALFLLGVAAGTAAYAQKDITPPSKPEAPQTFAWSFDSQGGYLGVQTQEVTRQNFARFGLTDVRGVAVEKVMDKSPAALAGIQAGDVIVKFNGDEVTSVRKLTRLIGEVDPDHQATVTVLRGGREQDVNVTIAKRPMPEFNNGNFQFNLPQMGEMPDFKNFPQLKDLPDLKNLPDLKDLPKGEFRQFEVPNGKGFVWTSGGRQIGVGIVPLSKQLADHFKVDGGAMIDDVRENSPAARAGLRAGDIVVEANGQAVKNEMDLIKAINEKKDGDVQLTVVRDGNRQTVSVTPETSKDGNFFFRSDDDNGLIGPATPGAFNMFKLAPGMPLSPTVPATLVFPKRIL